MKHKLLTLCIIMILSASLLCGCDALVDSLMGAPEETVPEQYPAGAIFPVMADEATREKSREIQLSDFALTIPEGYVYGKVDYENYSIYYVWQDKGDKEYAMDLDMDNMLYIYDGLDVLSPDQVIDKGQALRSIKGAYIGNFRTLVTGKSFNIDPEAILSSDEHYYVATFEGRSGEYLTTTYSAMCYPKTYYGIFGVERTTDSSDRRYYGFIFSNDARGEIFSRNEYESLLGQVKSALNIEKFYTLHSVESVFYDPVADVSDGRSYDQLVGIAATESASELRGLFYDTLLYYVEKTGRSYERENVDKPKEEQIPETNPLGQEEAATATLPADFELPVPEKYKGGSKPCLN